MSFPLSVRDCWYFVSDYDGIGVIIIAVAWTVTTVGRSTTRPLLSDALPIANE